jgi:hypothetical protein
MNMFVRSDGFDAVDAEQVLEPLDSVHVHAGDDAGSVSGWSRWRFVGGSIP